MAVLQTALRKNYTAMKWRPAKISEEAHTWLKLASAVTKSDMRDLASAAIIDHCKEIVGKAKLGNGILKRK